MTTGVRDDTRKNNEINHTSPPYGGRKYMLSNKFICSQNLKWQCKLEGLWDEGWRSWEVREILQTSLQESSKICYRKVIVYVCAI